MIGSKDGKEAKEEKHEANVPFKHENNLSEEIQYLYQGGETDCLLLDQLINVSKLIYLINDQKVLF